MTSALTPAHIYCPYCGESLELQIDTSAGSQRYVEDCQICCAPIEISVQIGLGGELIEIQANRDND